MAVVLIATLRPNADDHPEVRAVLESTIARVHEEDRGCQLYSLHEDGDDFVFIEKWADQEAFDAHLVSDATTAMTTALDGKLRSSEARFLTPLPFGDSRLGEI